MLRGGESLVEDAAHLCEIFTRRHQRWRQQQVVTGDAADGPRLGSDDHAAVPGLLHHPLAELIVDREWSLALLVGYELDSDQEAFASYITDRRMAPELTDQVPQPGLLPASSL